MLNNDIKAKTSTKMQSQNYINSKIGLRVLLITQGITRVVDPLLNSKHDVVGILESAPRSHNKITRLHKILGVLRFFYSRFKTQQLTLELKAKQACLPYRLIKSSNDVGLDKWIQDLSPDIIVVYSMSQLLKESIYNLPTHGAINLHPALLPEYRGPNPDFWQYYNMEMEPGATVHFIDKGEDTGDIIFQQRTHIPMGTKSPSRLDKLIGQTGVTLLLNALDSIFEGTAPRIKQPTNSPTVHARNVTMSEHKSIIDWQNWPIERIWHVLRGTETWLDALPQPTGLWKGHRWILENIDKNISKSTEVGEIGEEDGRYFVACKQGRIYLRRKFSVKTLITGLIR